MVISPGAWHAGGGVRVVVLGDCPQYALAMACRSCRGPKETKDYEGDR